MPHSSVSVRNTRAISYLLFSTIFMLLASSVFSGCSVATHVEAKSGELILYDWEEDIPLSVLEAFEGEYGIQVSYHAYTSTEEAVESLRAGKVYDVVVLENLSIPALIRDGLLAPLTPSNLNNFKNISANFRDLVYDPGNQYSIPFNWGTTGLLVRPDRVEAPVTRWSDLWDRPYSGKLAFWRGQPREVLGLALKSLGYSANTERPDELEAALERLLEIAPNIIFVEDFDVSNVAPLLEKGQAGIAIGYALDAVQSRQAKQPADYILPEEGTLLWGDSFIIPSRSPHKGTAELFLNYLLRPEIAAQIANQNSYATANEGAFPLIDPELFKDPVIYPTNGDLLKAEIILPLSAEGEALYDRIWERFLGELPTGGLE